MKQRGFTLLELIIAIGVIGLLAVVVVQLLLVSTQSDGRSEAVAEVNGNLRFALAKIEQDVHQASVATVSGNNDVLTLTVSASPIVYALSGGILTRNSAGITSSKVTVSDLYFKKLINHNSIFNTDATTVLASFKLAYNSTAPDREYETAAQTSILLP